MTLSRPLKVALVVAPAIVAFVAYDKMALAALRSKHASVSLPGRRAVVVGGTSGIGMGIAERLAMANADVTIVGRNKEAAEEILARMRKSGTGKHDFIQCDAQIIGNVPACAQAWTASAGGKDAPLDVLVLTQGIGSLAGYTETAEGIDRKLAIHHYSRQAFIEALLPNLRASKPGSGLPGPRVLSVLSGGVHSPYEGYATDPDLKKNFSLKNAADAAGLYNDVCLDARSREPSNANIAFIHAAPGVVSTNWGSEFPLPLQWMMKPLKVLMGTSPLDCAEAMLDPVFSQEVKGGFHVIGARAEKDKLTPVHEQALPVVYEHTKEVLARLMK